MKIKGVKPPKPASKEITFPREEGSITFVVEPVMDLFAVYESIYPEPKPPTKIEPGGSKTVLYDDPAYLKAYEAWTMMNTPWLIYHSIKNTPDLEFEAVDENDIATWGNIKKELLEVLSVGEYNLLADKVQEVSLPNEESLKEAMKVFAQARPQQGQ